MNYLDEEEMDLEQALEGLDVSTKSQVSLETQNLFKKAAKNTLRQSKKMNIRIDEVELNLLKHKAASQGLKYQSLVKSILHRYLTGQLIENPKVIV